MKKLNKVLFIGLMVTVMAVMSGCAMNVFSGLGGHRFAFNNVKTGEAYFEFSVGTKVTYVMNMPDLGSKSKITGTYLVNSTDTLILTFTNIEECYVLGVNAKDQMTASEIAKSLAEVSGTYTFTLDGKTLTLEKEDTTSGKVTLTKVK